MFLLIHWDGTSIHHPMSYPLRFLIENIIYLHLFNLFLCFSHFFLLFPPSQLILPFPFIKFVIVEEAFSRGLFVYRGRGRAHVWGTIFINTWDIIINHPYYKVTGSLSLCVSVCTKAISKLLNQYGLVLLHRVASKRSWQAL